MEKVMTPQEVIEVTINILNGINVPVQLTEQIAIPIAQSIKNLQLILDAQNEPKKEPKEAIDLGNIDEVLEDEETKE